MQRQSIVESKALEVDVFVLALLNCWVTFPLNVILKGPEKSSSLHLFECPQQAYL